jgi:hypothetical protein
MYYVYVYRDPRPTKNNQPVYVGKGMGDRDLSHWSKRSHNKPFQDFIAHLKVREMEAPCIRVFETENEQEAFDKEKELIALYGRRDIGTGTLFNKTNGGEGVAGYTKSEQEKSNDRANTTKNWQNPEYRAKVIAAQKQVQSTPEMLAIKSKNTTQGWAVEETREKRHQGIKAARNTDESKAKTSAQSKAQWADPAYATMQSANNKEIANRVEVKAAKAEALKARWADSEFKAMMIAARVAKKQAKST